jgi:hypothetical protein
MALKDTIENNPVIWTLGMLLAGFLAGIGAYKAVLEMADLQSVPKSALIAKPDERVISETEYQSLKATSNSPTAQKFAAAEKLNSDYKLLLTALATSIDGKVKYEMTQVQQPALKIYIDQLNDAIKKAKTKGLIEP